jgi:glycosyltransferase involved in cell wall biosynthesis
VRIAYVTPYQGPTVVERRQIVANRSMSNKTKIELVAKLLRSRAHAVEMFSHGEVIENRLKFYPAFAEPEPFDRDIPVNYISSLAVRRLNGLWASMQMVQLLKRRHQTAPFDAIIIFNLKRPQIACARYAVRHRIPVILEYEDDAFLTVDGELSNGIVVRYHRRAYRRVLNSVSGCIAVSPHLLSQVRPDLPKLLLRGVVGEDIVSASRRPSSARKNIVLFSGTHIKSNGVAELIAAWRMKPVSNWELHITGYGDMSDELRRMAQDGQGIVFHGLLSREELVSLMCSARICINPHVVSQTPGNVFAFKIIEYLAAGAHVLTTRMGTLEPEIEAGITYMADNKPETIAATLAETIGRTRCESTIAQVVQDRYGPGAVADALEDVLAKALRSGGGRRSDIVRFFDPMVGRPDK